MHQKKIVSKHACTGEFLYNVAPGMDFLYASPHSTPWLTMTRRKVTTLDGCDPAGGVGGWADCFLRAVDEDLGCALPGRENAT